MGIRKNAAAWLPGYSGADAMTHTADRTASIPTGTLPRACAVCGSSCELLDQRGAARALGVHRMTLSRWRCRQDYARHMEVRIGARIRYRACVIDRLRSGLEGNNRQYMAEFCRTLSQQAVCPLGSTCLFAGGSLFSRLSTPP